MNLRLLSYFVACVEHKTMHAAADARCISQPALSKAIQKLEEELGAQLLERRPRGVVPTPYGEVLFRYAKLVDAELRRATSEIDAMRGMAQGTISLGVMPNIAHVATSLVQIVTARHAGLKLKVLATSTTALLPALADGEIDFAVVLSISATLPGLVFEPLVSTRTIPVVRKGHPLLRRKSLRLEDFLAYPWIMGRFPPEHRACVNQTYLNAGLVPPMPAVDVNSIAYFADTLRNTDLIGMASYALIHSDDWGGNLQALEFDFGFPEEHLGIAYRENSVVLPGAALVREMLRSEIANKFRRES